MEQIWFNKNWRSDIGGSCVIKLPINIFAKAGEWTEIAALYSCSLSWCTLHDETKIEKIKLYTAAAVGFHHSGDIVYKATNYIKESYYLENVRYLIIDMTAYGMPKYPLKVWTPYALNIKLLTRFLCAPFSVLPCSGPDFRGCMQLYHAINMVRTPDAHNIKLLPPSCVATSVLSCLRHNLGTCMPLYHSMNKEAIESTTIFEHPLMIELCLKCFNIKAVWLMHMSESGEHAKIENKCFHVLWWLLSHPAWWGLTWETCLSIGILWMSDEIRSYHASLIICKKAC